jgi:hypothetical protein
MTTEISSDCFARRCQILSPFPPISAISAIPNQLNSTLSSSSSQYSSDSDEGAEEKGGIRSNLELEDYMNDSALSVDGEFDVRIDIISMSMRPLAASTSSSSPVMCASAPPLYDYESDDGAQQKKSTTTTTPHKADVSKQKTQETYKETCIICYEDIADVVVGEEGQINIADFCRTCKYTVHLDCIDEYRVNKLNDAVAERNGESIASSSVGIKCLMCSLEVERIYVRRNGDIDIIKNQIARSSNQERLNSRDIPRQLSPQQRLQRDLHAQVLNNMERRMRRERRNRFRQKCCNFCFFTILAMSIAVIVIMRFA